MISWSPAIYSWVDSHRIVRRERARDGNILIYKGRWQTRISEQSSSRIKRQRLPPFPPGKSLSANDESAVLAETLLLTGAHRAPPIGCDAKTEGLACDREGKGGVTYAMARERKREETSPRYSERSNSKNTHYHQSAQTHEGGSCAEVLRAMWQSTRRAYSKRLPGCLLQAC